MGNYFSSRQRVQKESWFNVFFVHIVFAENIEIVLLFGWADLIQGHVWNISQVCKAFCNLDAYPLHMVFHLRDFGHDFIWWKDWNSISAVLR